MFTKVLQKCYKNIESATKVIQIKIECLQMRYKCATKIMYNYKSATFLLQVRYICATGKIICLQMRYKRATFVLQTRYICAT